MGVLTRVVSVPPFRIGSTHTVLVEGFECKEWSKKLRNRKKWRNIVSVVRLDLLKFSFFDDGSW